MEIQAASIARNLPDILTKINDKLNRKACWAWIDALKFRKPDRRDESYRTDSEPVNESLHNILIRGVNVEFHDELDY